MLMLKWVKLQRITFQHVSRHLSWWRLFCLKQFLQFMRSCVQYKTGVKQRLVILLILNLAFFQLAEFLVCTNSTVATQASRFGYASITLLPPLGLYLMSELTYPMRKKAAGFMFLTAFGLMAYFLLSPSAFSGYQCTGNYVIFQIGTSQMRLYSLYYFQCEAGY